MELKAMSTYEPKTAKKVYVYRNGLGNADPKLLVVNDRQVRDFSTFLARVTSGIKAPVAVRNIYTPSGGHRVRTLGALESGRHYVAGGQEMFKKVQYSSAPRLLPGRPVRAELTIPHRAAQAVVASARYKRPLEKPFIIHVFRNGDELFRGARVLLPRRIMGSWEHVLELVTEKTELYTPAKRLCTLDGRIVHAASELQDGGKYVALEGSRLFRRVAYCALEPAHTTALLHKVSPQHKHRLYTLPRVRRPARRRRHQHQPASHPLGAGRGDAQQEPIHADDKPHPPVELLDISRQRRKTRPMAGRRNKEGRAKAIRDHREDSIFGGSPTPLHVDDDSVFNPMPSPPHARPRLADSGYRAMPTNALNTSSEEPEILRANSPEHLPRRQPSPAREAPGRGEADQRLALKETQAIRRKEPKKKGKKKTSLMGTPATGSLTSCASDKGGVAGGDEGGVAGGEQVDLTQSGSSGASRGHGVFYAGSSGTKAQEEGGKEAEEGEGKMPEYEEQLKGDTLFKAKPHGSLSEDAEAVQESKDVQVEHPVPLEEAREVEDEEEGEKDTSGRTEATAATIGTLPDQTKEVRELQPRPQPTSVDLSVARRHSKEESGGVARGDSPAPPAKTTGRTELLQNGGNLTSSGSSVHSVKTRSTHSLAVAVEKETTGDRRDDGVRVQERASVPAESPSLAAEVSKEEEEELEVEEEVEEEEEEVEEVVVEEEEEEEEGRREEEEVKPEPAPGGEGTRAVSPPTPPHGGSTATGPSEEEAETNRPAEDRSAELSAGPTPRGGSAEETAGLEEEAVFVVDDNS